MLKTSPVTQDGCNGRWSAGLLVLCACLSLSLEAWGQACLPSAPLNCAYVTDGSAHDVLAVDRINHTVTTIKSLKSNQGNTVDLRIGGDSRVYILTATGIFRMNLDGSNFQTVFSGSSPTGFTGIRFDAAGDAFVNTASGVWEFANLIQAAGTNSSPFPKPGKVAGNCAGCTSGGLAFTANGDLLIASNSGNTGTVSCLASGSLPSSPLCSGQQLTTAGTITGLAVDSLGNIILSSGSSVTSWSCASSPCSPNYSVNLGSDIPAYLEAVPDPTGSPTADPSSACNTAAPSILVSTADSSAKNGKVWSLDSVATPNVSAPLPCTITVPTPQLLASLGTKVPGVGMAAPGTLHTLTKAASENAPTSNFNYGSASLELSPTSSDPAVLAFSGSCDISMTKEQLAVTDVAARLANNDMNLPLSLNAVTFNGEQGWVSGFHGAYPANCVNENPAVFTHIGISGFYSYKNPHIVLIPDCSNNVCPAAHVDDLPFIYKFAPLQGGPGDPIVRNAGTFTSAPTTIIVADVGFDTNAGIPTSGYTFCGFLSPFVEPPTNKKNANVVNSGQSATFKFQLGVGSCSKLVDDATAQQIGTGFSVAQFADAGGNAAFAEANGAGKGNSVTPPKFKYDATGHLFLYTLDTTNYCNGSFEATANGDSFQPHTLVFTVVGAPSSCSTQ